MLSPLDDRYKNRVNELSAYFGDFALVKYRVKVEVAWLCKLLEHGIASPADRKKWFYICCESISYILKNISNISDSFSASDYTKICEIEDECNHDVKAVELFIAEKVANSKDFSTKKHMSHIKSMIHWGCTSEDINNFSYGLMLRDCLYNIFIPKMEELTHLLNKKAKEYKKVTMLSRTHGQPASPTTMGKELFVFSNRLSEIITDLKQIKIRVKFNGAVGNFNAHKFCIPELDWQAFSREFVESFANNYLPDIGYQPYSTQVESRDYMANIFACIVRFNNVLMDFCRDMWGYISLNYFKQENISKEVGSSTMPHKINPIDFENAEGNIGIANALFEHLSNKITISRFQRDLSCSTVMRNIGVPFGHSLLAYKSILKGINKLSIDKDLMLNELKGQWQLLAEPLQTMMRLHDIPDAYNIIKEFTRGKSIGEKEYHSLIDFVNLPPDIKLKLKNLRPENYTGLLGEM